MLRRRNARPLKVVADEVPDLIVLDLNLPVLSGVEVCRILRMRPASRHVPIIMVTARAAEDDRVIGFDTSTETRAVDVHVGRLRAKLGAAAPQIETVVGLGYRFVDQAEGRK